MDTNEIATLQPDTEKVNVQGEELIIGPFRWKQFREVVKHISSISFDATDGGDIDLLGLVARHGDEIDGVIQVATGKPKEWTDNLDLPDVLALAGAIVRVNRDFFVQRLAPQFREVAAKLAGSLRTGQK